MPETQTGISPRGGAGGGEDILSRIVATKWEEIARLRPAAAELRLRAEGAPPPRDFRRALAAPETVSLIAEVKRRSPGAGAIRPELDAVDLARSYEAAGAAAISVLTDESYFGGSLADLEAVRAAVSLPVLRKDFVLDPLQLWEARGGGADAILLIVRILEDGPLRDLRLLAGELGMAVLVEVHGAGELERALASGADLIGINNRDLSTFTTRLETTLDLLAEIPHGVVCVSESGIRQGEEVARLGRSGVDAVLVGESLLRAPDPAVAARALCGKPKQARSGGEE